MNRCYSKTKSGLKSRSHYTTIMHEADRVRRCCTNCGKAPGITLFIYAFGWYATYLVRVTCFMHRFICFQLKCRRVFQRRACCRCCSTKLKLNTIQSELIARVVGRKKAVNIFRLRLHSLLPSSQWLSTRKPPQVLFYF